MVQLPAFSSGSGWPYALAWSGEVFVPGLGAMIDGTSSGRLARCVSVALAWL